MACSFQQVVNGIVVEHLDFGVILEFDGVLIQVQAPELSWFRRKMAIADEFPLGTSVPVLILRFNPDDCLFIGSIKRTYEGNNPFCRYAEAGVDQTYSATVVDLGESDQYCIGKVRLEDGIVGECWLKGLGVQVGDAISVYPIEVDARLGLARFHVGDEPPKPRRR